MAAGDEKFDDKTMVASGETMKKSIPAGEHTPPILQVLLGPTAYQGRQFVLSDGAIVGRGHDGKIFIDDRSLSRQHARFEIKGTEVYIVDLDSTNKTILNGSPIQPQVSVKLKNNDQIKTGNVIFKFLEQGSLEAVASQQLMEKANKDALTGAWSKGALLEKGPEAFKRAVALNEQLSLIVFDIDHFKKINDGHGHPGGDYVLRELGRVVGGNLIRSSDYFSRFGGEEFVLILSQTSPKTALEIAERIRMTIQTTDFEFEGKKIPVTISLGVVTKTAVDQDWASLFDRGDKALYSSKQNGRNRVTVAP